ncbi:MAG TPA: hypothetical protein VG222_10205 [Vicinamibacterales bacterium]|nr:hypothetical protein [Vicinamibacterales bacterium]
MPDVWSVRHRSVAGSSGIDAATGLGNVTPAVSETLKVPNACVPCHKDKTTAWAAEALASWPEFSPWRVGR